MHPSNGISMGHRRPIRIANCSGAATDSGDHMFNQAKYGPVDVISGDYLAEATLASDALKMNDDSKPGWVPSALDGIEMSLDLIDQKRIKVIVNGGSLNPSGLAVIVHKMILDRNLNLRVAFVDGDNLLPDIDLLLSENQASRSLRHLDCENPNVSLAKDLTSFLDDREGMPIIAANAYLGYRAIKRGLEDGADIIICGRVADASPVIGAASWWYKWNEWDYDALAGALVAGHLIECSTYVTGANFAGAYRYPPSAFVNLSLPIAEIAHDGSSVITKHDNLGGFVTADTVKCQLLYELQGNIYLNSDVKADLKNVYISGEGPNRVLVSGIRGYPPPPTTKLAIFYRAGYQLEILLNACGYAIEHKWDIQEIQIRSRLTALGVLDNIDKLEFQRVGTPKENPDSQLSSTTYMRIFAQSKDQSALLMVPLAWNYCFMSHFPGMHCSLDLRTILPRPFLGYFPAIVEQRQLHEAVTILNPHDANDRRRIPVGAPRITEELAARENYETRTPRPLDSFGATVMRPLGDLVLGRSGDKGGNVNLGLFVQNVEQYDWLKSFMTRSRLQNLMGKDWKSRYFIERVELPRIFAVHFVVYGPLGRGVSSSSLLDNLGKGFAEYIRAVWVPLPRTFAPRGHSRL